jgi:glycosyltransferase involved in cell wall biosynthesis
LVRLYQQSDIVVSLSRHEGFGYTAAEAMACGKPVVAFDVPGLRDVVLAGKTGVLVEPGDVRAMATACAGLMGDPERRAGMGAAGREWVVAHFSPEMAARQYLSLYRELTASRGGI